MRRLCTYQLWHKNEAKKKEKKFEICFFNMNLSVTILEHFHVTIVLKSHIFLLHLSLNAPWGEENA